MKKIIGLCIPYREIWNEIKKGCDLGDEDGCFSVGMVIYYGDEREGITADKSEGRKYFKKACMLGKEDACALFLNKTF